MFDLHMPTEVTLQVESAGAVRTLKWLAASMEMHVTQEIIHSVKRLSTNLEKYKKLFNKQNNTKNGDV